MKSSATTPNFQQVNDTQETNRHSVRHVYSDSNITQSMTQTTSSIPNGNDHQEYEKQAEEMLEDIWKLYNGNESWADEAKSQDGLDIVTSKNFPKWGKVFRLISTITGTHANIVEMLFERQEDIPKWSPSVNECKILETINKNLYITYQLTNEQAQGFIAKRDFVNITARQCKDETVILAAQACEYPSMPPRENCVRAENGLTAYIIEKIDSTTCKFIWILNVDLKGWIPQYLINSSLANVQLDLVQSLRDYLLQTQ